MPQKISLFVIMFFITACKDHTKLVPVVPIECHPQEEVCDGKDNDCNGKIDEYISIECSTACGTGIIYCGNDGKLSECPAPKPAPSDWCDGLDNDCDGLIDEDAVITACYPRGEINKEYYKEIIPPRACQFGVKYCANGKYTSCEGAIEPTAEKCDGNGQDEDCDGQIDEDVAKSIDIVLILDESCSMITRIQELVDATVKWATKYESRANLRCALVTLSGSSSVDGTVYLEKNFSNVKDFISVLKLQKANLSGGLESTIDAVYDISTPENPLNLNWTPGANKIIIIYSDEDPQSHTKTPPTPPTTELQALDEAKNNNIPIHVFTSSYYLAEWKLWKSQVFLQGMALEKALDEIIAENSCK